MGMVLGTAAYMAPEQAKGRPVDRRADLWAFGAVVYEMLTGRRAFEGGDVTEVLASVIKDTPSLDALPPGTPASIRRLLRRCLHKDPRERLADASTARLEIAEAISGGPSAASPGAPASRRPRLSAATAGAALLLASRPARPRGG
jgi:serine/threonine protein kinase